MGEIFEKIHSYWASPGVLRRRPVSCPKQRSMMQWPSWTAWTRWGRFRDWWSWIYTFTGWWQLKYFLFSPLFGEDSHFDEYFSKGLKPPIRCMNEQVRYLAHVFWTYTLVKRYRFFASESFCPADQFRNQTSKLKNINDGTEVNECRCVPYYRKHKARFFFLGYSMHSRMTVDSYALLYMYVLSRLYHWHITYWHADVWSEIDPTSLWIYFLKPFLTTFLPTW